MQALDTDRPVPKSKKWGALLAAFVGIASLLAVVVTQEPKSAVSSPVPAEASLAPPIAGTKSEAEILLRGKSFSIFKRNLAPRFGGDVTSITAKEGSTVKAGTILAEYTLDEAARLEVQRVLYPEKVIELKQVVYDLEVGLDKLNNATLPTKKIELEKAGDDLKQLQELRSKDMASADAVKNKKREMESIEKSILEIRDSVKQTNAKLRKAKKDLAFFKEKHKRDLDLLEWKAQRSFVDSDIPRDKAFIKAPIDGQVIWISPGFRPKAEVRPGESVVTLAPMQSMVVRCKVHELDLVKLTQGDRGNVTFDALPQTKYLCRVSRIPWVSRDTNLDVPADYVVECAIDNLDDSIKEGLTCNVKVSIKK